MIDFAQILYFLPSWLTAPFLALVALIGVRICGNIIRFILDCIPFT